ncbi:MAG TPA: hypothetical protein VGT41_04605 [Candidatus Babeliales bacterium]|nr:hypothetical protein [Candidatus Babeliales bacterium]
MVRDKKIYKISYVISVAIFLILPGKIKAADSDEHVNWHDSPEESIPQRRRSKGETVPAEQTLLYMPWLNRKNLTFDSLTGRVVPRVRKKPVVEPDEEMEAMFGRRRVTPKNQKSPVVRCEEETKEQSGRQDNHTNLQKAASQIGFMARLRSVTGSLTPGQALRFVFRGKVPVAPSQAGEENKETRDLSSGITKSSNPQAHIRNMYFDPNTVRNLRKADYPPLRPPEDSKPPKPSKKSVQVSMSDFADNSSTGETILAGMDFLSRPLGGGGLTQELGIALRSTLMSMVAMKMMGVLENLPVLGITAGYAAYEIIRNGPQAYLENIARLKQRESQQATITNALQQQRAEQQDIQNKLVLVESQLNVIAAQKRLSDTLSEQERDNLQMSEKHAFLQATLLHERIMKLSPQVVLEPQIAATRAQRLQTEKQVTQMLADQANKKQQKKVLGAQLEKPSSTQVAQEGDVHTQPEQPILTSTPPLASDIPAPTGQASKEQQQKVLGAQVEKNNAIHTQPDQPILTPTPDISASTAAVWMRAQTRQKIKSGD